MKGTPDIQFNRPYKECMFWGGQRQSGKSVGMLNFILDAAARGIRIEVFDTLGVIYAKLKQNGITPPRSLKIYRPSWIGRSLPSYNDGLAEFLPWCDRIYNLHRRIAAVEEIHMFHKTKFVLPKELYNLVNQGGNNDVAIWMNSQRFAQCHNDLLAACPHHNVYKMSLPQDIRYLEDLLPKALRHLASGDPKNPDALCVENMPDYHFLYYNMNTRFYHFYEPLKPL